MGAGSCFCAVLVCALAHDMDSEGRMRKRRLDYRQLSDIGRPRATKRPRKTLTMPRNLASSRRGQAKRGAMARP